MCIYVCTEYPYAVSSRSAKEDEKKGQWVGVYCGRTREGWNKVSTQCCSPK